MAAASGHANDRAMRREVGGSIEAATPRPWRVFTTKDGLKVIGIGTVEGEGILDAGWGVWNWKHAEGLANAELVVRAVNSHDDLLAVAQLYLSLGDHPQDDPFAQAKILHLTEAALAAVAKATGQSLVTPLDAHGALPSEEKVAQP